MLRICERQRKESVLLNEIDNYLFAEAIEVVNDKIVLTKELQKLFITENFTRYSDITEVIEDIKKCQDWTVICNDTITKEEKEVTIEIEGGI